jgi:hypothetical protein
MYLNVAIHSLSFPFFFLATCSLSDPAMFCTISRLGGLTNLRRDAPKHGAMARVFQPALWMCTGRRRAWTAEQKAQIVAEGYADGEMASAVARRYGLMPHCSTASFTIAR